MIYSNYKYLQKMEYYQFVNSEGEAARYRFDGYYYCDEWHEDAIVLHDPENGVLEWPSCEFQAALDRQEDPNKFLEDWENWKINRNYV